MPFISYTPLNMVVGGHLSRMKAAGRSAGERQITIRLTRRPLCKESEVVLANRMHHRRLSTKFWATRCALKAT
jgi:hypothetical protein